MTRRQEIWVCAVILLIYCGIRLVSLRTFPIFMDESVHLQSAERAVQVSPFADVNIGRLGTTWWYALFAPFNSAHPLFVARAVTVLINVASAAVVASIARRSAGKGAGVVVLLLLLISPFHHFFERLALADSVAALPTLGAIWMALHLRHRWRWRDALGCGLLLFISFAIKFSALPYYGIPVAAALFLVPASKDRERWKKKLLWGGIALGAACGLLALFTLVMRWRGYDIWSNSFSLAVSARADFNSAQTFDLARIAGNAAVAFGVLGDYWGAILAVAGLLGVMWWLARRRFFLFVAWGAPWLAMFISIPQETRYWLVPSSLLLAGAAGLLVEIRPPVLRTVAIGLVFVATLIHGLPIWQGYYSDPTYAALPQRDRAQYVESDASGSPFPALGALLIEHQPQKILGVLSLCQGLRYTYWQTLPVECRRISPSGEDMDALREWVDQERGDDVWVILESSPFIPDDIEGELVAAFARPGGLAELRVLRLTSAQR